MNIETEIAGRQELESALERTNLDLRTATAEYDNAKRAVLAWKRSHPTLDSIKIINGVAHVVVNALSSASSALKTLCANEAKARQRFSEVLRVRADLLRQLQRI